MTGRLGDSKSDSDGEATGPRRRLVQATMSYYPAHVYLQSASAALPDPPQDRFCSVKGCAKRLPQDYTLKMCDQCRGRHRIYATTKRAKRKLEKLAVIQNTVNLADTSSETQPVAWMPPDALSEPVQSQASSSRFDQPEEFTTHIWATQIDPRLFNPKSSELAGALTLPPINPPSVSNDPDAVFDPNDNNQSASTPGPASTSKLPPPQLRASLRAIAL
ncbi:hypothetical protein EVG20_g4039 [Dentipellis fragilis]|uniref:Uncharacterized protein n=1 Tax=Dentipellis fragilis TaxID=205917 RepID=A0A4Y9YZE7_9AGAM|nr:hypothetical protein EVG20_g4039 [Dentipellis fragilis]